MPLTGPFYRCEVRVDSAEYMLALPGDGGYLAPDLRLAGKVGRMVWALGPRGQIQDWWLVDGALWVRGPVDFPWPELAAEVARALGVQLVPYRLEGKMPVFAPRATPPSPPGVTS